MRETWRLPFGKPPCAPLAVQRWVTVVVVFSTTEARTGLVVRRTTLRLTGAALRAVTGAVLTVSVVTAVVAGTGAAAAARAERASAAAEAAAQLGREACRGRVGPYVYNSVVAGS